MNINYRYKETNSMKKVFKVSIIFICLILTCLIFSSINVRTNNILSISQGNHYESKDILDNNQQNTQNIYVFDEYNGDNIETNIDDDNYYMIVSNKKISDEKAIEMAEELDNTSKILQERMNQTINDMLKFQKMMQKMFEF